jgi:hypothetical protein
MRQYFLSWSLLTRFYKKIITDLETLTFEEGLTWTVIGSLEILDDTVIDVGSMLQLMFLGNNIIAHSLMLWLVVVMRVLLVDVT